MLKLFNDFFLYKYIDSIDKTEEYMKSHNSISYSSEEEKQNTEKYNKIFQNQMTNTKLF